MKISLYSLNYAPELTGIGKYNGEMCTALAEKGHDVTAIVAQPYYPEWKVHKGYSKYFYSTVKDKGVSIMRCPLYVPESVTTLKRLSHLFSFAFTSMFALFSKTFGKPDVIILVQPTLFCAPITLLYAKLTGAKAVMHIQDFEVDAMFGLGMVKSGRFATLVKKIERFLMSKFDAVSTISLSMIENTLQKGITADKTILFPNWSDIHFITPETDGSALKAEWGFNPSDNIVLYAGNIGKKQGLEIILTAAKHFREQENVKFVIVGAGAYVDTMKTLTDEMNLPNVFYKPLQPWERVAEMLALADIHLVIQKKGVADAVLPSKLTNILSCGGHAIVTAEKATELGLLHDKFPGIYSLIDPEDEHAFIDALSLLLNKDLTNHNKVARLFAEETLDKTTVIDTFVANLKKTLQLK